MKLESDTTLIFAIGDFDIKKVLNKDKKIDSPYNTYLNQGYHQVQYVFHQLIQLMQY